MVRIKVCGLSRQCDIDAVNELCPEYIGFVFAPSKRRITYEFAFELRERLDRNITAVGVFVNAPKNEIISAVNDRTIDAVQLHGDETEEYIKELKAKINVPMIKAVKVHDSKTLEDCKKTSADMLLLDGGCGDGKTFDWDLIKNIDRPYFLAGGLSPENVTEAIKKTRPFAVDVSSGVETDGLKDKNKIREFIRRARDA